MTDAPMLTPVREAHRFDELALDAPAAPPPAACLISC
jgi:hypothetical protein